VDRPRDANVHPGRIRGHTLTSNRILTCNRYILHSIFCNSPRTGLSRMDAPVTPKAVPDLTDHQMDVLRILTRGPRHVRQIARTRRSPTGLTGDLEELAKRGLIRHPTSDAQPYRRGEKINWEITDSGRNHLFEADQLDRLDGDAEFRYKKSRGRIVLLYWLNPKTNIWERLQPPL
jgi:hypothetical protein